MNKQWITLSLIAMLATTAGCGSDNDKSRRTTEQRNVQPEADGKAQLRVVHAVADAPAVNVLANGAVLLDGVPYGVASGLLAVDPGTYSVQVDGIVPGGVATVVGPADIQLSDDEITNVLAINTLAAIEPLIVTTPDTQVAANEVRLTVVHAAAAAPAVDVYVTDPAASLTTPVGTFAFKETLGPVTVPSGNYRIQVTLAGDSAVIFDSGDGGLALAGGADLFVTAIANTGPGSSPIHLLVDDGSGSSIIRDDTTPASLKVVHAAPGVGNAEVFVSSASLGLSDVELIDTIEYLQVLPAADVALEVAAADDYAVSVAQDGSGIASALISQADISLDAGQEYTAIATGGSSGEPAQLLLIADDNRAVATEARVNVIHAAPAAGTVDVYVNAAGSVSAAAILNGDVTPAIAGFAFGATTGYLSLAAGDYDVRVVAGGSVLAIDSTVSLSNGLVANAIAVGPDEVDNAPAGFGLVLTTN